MNKAGEYVLNLKGISEYKSFKPSLLPLKEPIEITSEILKNLAEANKKLSELNSFVKYIPNTDLFIDMYIRKEALLTSQIEGTQCTLDDVLNPQIDENKNLEVKDVINYINATSFAIEEMKKLPLCNRLLKEIHKILLDGIRGNDKNPGEFRKSQNWIGAANCNLHEARYVPPNVDDMNEAMDNLEEYLNEDENGDPLIKIALVHYQFETIHPFLDGNGRIGRLLILLFLLDRKILTKPVLYISYFLKKNQIEYYDRMSEVRKNGNYEQWINFFLEALSSCADNAIMTLNLLNDLHNKNISLLEMSKNINNSVKTIFDYLEESPIIEIGKTANNLEMSFNTVKKSVNKLVDLNILKEVTSNKRNKIYIYEDYLAILRKDTEI